MKFKDLPIDAQFVLDANNEEEPLKQKQGENSYIFAEDLYIDPETEVEEIP